jgi:hypothetical protein
MVDSTGLEPVIRLGPIGQQVSRAKRTSRNILKRFDTLPLMLPLWVMASLRKKARSPYFFACFTDADGTRTQRSTKQTKEKKAQAIAEQFEKAAKLSAERRLGEAQARRVLLISTISPTVNRSPAPLLGTL